MRTYGLRTKIVVPTILLFIISLGVSTWLTYDVSRSAMEDAAIEHVNLIADATAKSMAVWFAERPREISAWSERSAIQAVVGSAEAASPAKVNAANAMLRHFNAKAPWYEIIVLADRQGNAVCSSTPEFSKDISIMDRDYFRQTMAGESALSGVVRSKTSGNPVVVVAVPVQAGTAPVGVLLGALDLKFFTREFVEPLKIGDSGYVFVADRQGVIFSHPDTGLVMATNLASMAFGTEILRDKNGSMRYIYKDEEVLAAYRTDPAFGWIVVARALTGEITTATRTVRNLNLLVGLAAILLTTLVLLMLSKPIARTITNLADVALLVTNGRLAEARRKIEQINLRRRPPHDETGQLWRSMSAMADSLYSLVSQVQQAGAQLAATAGEIEAAAREQESVIANFGAATTDVVTAAKEISATSQDLSKTMETVKSGAEGAAVLADTGRAGLADMENSTRQLMKAAVSISDKLAVINVKTGTIGGVVATITKVADQTNLLSLNAAIEAEKAGKYGQGFAVVAGEIRRLADQTAVATLDIERMVGEMQSAVAAGVVETGRFSAEVERDTETAASISRPLSGIIAQVKELAPKFEMVNDGMRAQSQGAGQISQSLAQISQGAVKTAESLRQFNEATGQLRNAAQRLQAEVAKFKV